MIPATLLTPLTSHHSFFSYFICFPHMERRFYIRKIESNMIRNVSWCDVTWFNVSHRTSVKVRVVILNNAQNIQKKAVLVAPPYKIFV